MPRASLDLQNSDDLNTVGGEWKYAVGLVPRGAEPGAGGAERGQPRTPARLRRLRLGDVRRPRGVADRGAVVYLVSD